MASLFFTRGRLAWHHWQLWFPLNWVLALICIGLSYCRLFSFFCDTAEIINNRVSIEYTKSVAENQRRRDKQSSSTHFTQPAPTGKSFQPRTS
jgi:hypothetical protein